MSPDLWPLNPRSMTPDPNIDWQSVGADTLRAARVAIIKKVNVKHLTMLRSRYKHLFGVMTPAAQEQATALIEGRPADKVILATEDALVAPAGDDKKSKLMTQLTSLKGEAEGDVAMQLKIIELEAKLESLLNQKTQVDPVVNIFVDTGVRRDV